MPERTRTSDLQVRNLMLYPLSYGHPGAASSGELAEREGFEPSEEDTPFNGLANRRTRPLCDLSVATFYAGLAAIVTRRQVVRRWARSERRSSSASMNARRTMAAEARRDHLRNLPQRVPEMPSTRLPIIGYPLSENALEGALRRALARSRRADRDRALGAPSASAGRCAGRGPRGRGLRRRARRPAAQG